jgi:hypothetical protein
MFRHPERVTATMNASPAIPLILLLATLAWLALTLFFVTRTVSPKRTGHEPHCRRCGYNLTGTPGDRCSECGATLNDRTIVHGTRQRRAWHVVSAAVLLLIGIPLVTTLVDDLRSVDWIRYRPAAGLLDDLQATNAQTQRAALIELIRREFHFTLEPAERQELIAYCLAYQRRTYFTQPPAGEIAYLVRCFETDRLTKSQESQFLRQSANAALLLPRNAVAGQPFRWGLHGYHRTSAAKPGEPHRRAADLWYVITFEQLLLNNQRQPTRVDGARGKDFYEGELTINQPGTHQLEITLNFEVLRGAWDQEDNSQLVYKGDRTLTATIEVVTE